MKSSPGRLFLALASIVLGSCASGHQDPWRVEPTPVRDPAALEARLGAVVGAGQLQDISEHGAPPLWLARFSSADPRAPRILVCAGVHGDETAGVEWALELVERLGRAERPSPAVWVDVLPVINHWGWIRDTRYNAQRRDINRDFASFATPEGRALRRLFEDTHYELVVDHHEDDRARGFYLYEYAPARREPARLALTAASDLGYPLEQDVSMVILRARNGLIHAPLWGLWYMRAARQLSLANYLRLAGNRAVYTVESPRSYPPEDRILLHRTAYRSLAKTVLGGEGAWPWTD